MTHKDLEVWKLSIDLVVRIYDITNSLPSEEKFGLISQMRRSAVSVPSNIAEGAGRSSTKEFMRFIDIASGSLSELETQLIIIEKLNFISADKLPDIEMKKIRSMLFRLKTSLAKKLG